MATLLGWVASVALVAGLTGSFGGDFEADYSVPDSDSQRARALLEDRFPDESTETVDVVIGLDRGVDAVKPRVRALLAELAQQPHVAQVDDPYLTPDAISPDRRTMVAQLRLDVADPTDMPASASGALLAVADSADARGFQVDLAGRTIEAAEQPEAGSELIGVLVAAVILLVMFGSVVAAGLPILVALFGLALSGSLVGLIAAVVDVPDWATAVAAMMGLGVGIDYILLMVTRFREWRAAGLDPEAAAVATVDTAGRSVILAGSTVVVSMLGLFAMGLTYMRGVSIVTIAAVLVVMAASLTLFPALLGFVGRHIDRLRLPIRRRGAAVMSSGQLRTSRGWRAWSDLVDRHRVLACVLGVGLLAALMSPVLTLRLGFPDAGDNSEATTTRQAYDRVAEGFGPGANGPLLIAADLGRTGQAQLGALTEKLASTHGVAAVSPPRLNAAFDTAILTVVPETGPQDRATEDLVRTLREHVIPSATQNSDVKAYVGGTTAASLDASEDLAERIPLLIGGVVLLSMLLLLLAFRSLVIPLTAAVMNLLSVGAAYGVMALVAQGQWAGRLVGIDTQAPVPAFVPVISFAILFGLSMDYEVFLVSRMRESWLSHRSNARAIVDGLAGTGRVITAAAAIMIAVFAAFVPSPDVILKLIGVGMSMAILVDATVIRLLLVPALMHLLGTANWWLPARLDRHLPLLRIEPSLNPAAPVPEPPGPITDVRYASELPLDTDAVVGAEGAAR